MGQPAFVGDNNSGFYNVGTQEVKTSTKSPGLGNGFDTTKSTMQREGKAVYPEAHKASKDVLVLTTPNSQALKAPQTEYKLLCKPQCYHAGKGKQDRRIR